MILKLQLEQDEKFREKERLFERTSWIIMGALLTFALLGMFGGGPLSFARAHSKELKLTYPRFERATRLSELRIRLPMQNGQGSLWISNKSLAVLNIERIHPEPQVTQQLPQKTVYKYQVVQPFIDLTIRFQFEALGLLNTQLGSLETKQQLEFSTFVYP